MCKTQLKKVTDEPKCRIKTKATTNNYLKSSLWMIIGYPSHWLLFIWGEEDRLIKEN